MQRHNKIKDKFEVWKEMLPSIGVSELHRLLCRLRRHATIVSCKGDNGCIAVVVRYDSIRDRISSRVLLSSWVGRRNYRSVRLLSSRVVSKHL